jgi:hypothetical protein
VPTNEELRTLAQEYGVELRITNPPALTKGGEIVPLPGIRRPSKERGEVPSTSDFPSMRFRLLGEDEK